MWVELEVENNMFQHLKNNRKMSGLSPNIWFLNLNVSILFLFDLVLFLNCYYCYFGFYLLYTITNSHSYCF